MQEENFLTRTIIFIFTHYFHQQFIFGNVGQKVIIHKDIFACLFSIHNIISLSCHEQVC